MIARPTRVAIVALRGRSRPRASWKKITPSPPVMSANGSVSSPLAGASASETSAIGASSRTQAHRTTLQRSASSGTHRDCLIATPPRSLNPSRTRAPDSVVRRSPVRTERRVGSGDRMSKRLDGRVERSAHRSDCPGPSTGGHATPHRARSRSREAATGRRVGRTPSGRVALGGGRRTG